MKLMWTFIFIFTFFKLVRLELSPNFANCLKFFYQETAPFSPEMDSTKKICQKLGTNYFFATEYDTEKRIPLFSAYMLSFEKCGKREDDWFFEAELANIDNPSMVEMDYENHAYSPTSIYGSRQAVEKDFITDTYYDKGHLNPQMFHCESSESRQATNTMTNIAPQYYSFNQKTWNTFETDLYRISKIYCSFEGARRYYITGVKPSLSDYISDNRVNVPTHYWTAVCCDSSGAKGVNRSEGWSAAFEGKNVKDSKIYIYTLEKFQTNFYKLFANYIDENGNTVSNCLFDPKKADTITDAIAAQTDMSYVKVKTSENNIHKVHESLKEKKKNEL